MPAAPGGTSRRRRAHGRCGAHLLREHLKAFYSDPENERRFEAWMEERRRAATGGPA